MLSAKNKIFIIGLIACAIITFGYINNIQPLQIQLKNMQQEQAALKSQIAIAKQKLQQLPKLRQHLNALKKTFPCSLSWQSTATSSSLPQLLEIIAATSIKTDISIIAIKPLAKTKIQNKQRNLTIPFQDINFVATGTYQQIANFLNCLNQSELLIEVPTFSIHPITFGATDEQLIIAATIRTYAPHNYKPPTKTNSAKAISINQNPFNQTQTNASSLPLTTWESSELRFLGTVQQNDQTWAILNAPNGAIYYATTGTMIGIHHSTIKQITKYTIITNNTTDNIYR